MERLYAVRPGKVIVFEVFNLSVETQQGVEQRIGWLNEIHGMGEQPFVRNDATRRFCTSDPDEAHDFAAGLIADPT